MPRFYQTVLSSLLFIVLAGAEPVFTSSVTVASVQAQVELSAAEQTLQNALPEGVTLANASTGQINRALKKAVRANATDTALVKELIKAAVASDNIGRNLSMRRAIITATRAIIRTTARTPGSDVVAALGAVGDAMNDLFATGDYTEAEKSAAVTTFADTADASRLSNDQLASAVQSVADKTANNLAEDTKKDLDDSLSGDVVPRGTRVYGTSVSGSGAGAGGGSGDGSPITP